MMLASCAVTGMLCAQQALDSRTADGHAVTDWNAGRIRAPKEKLAVLLGRHPNYFRAYAVFWQALARYDGQDQRDHAIGQALAPFAEVPADQRTEDFCYAFSGGLKLPERGEEAERIRQEAIGRYPRGKLAQSVFLDRALNSGNVHQPIGKLDTLREELYGIAPCAAMVLKDGATRAIEAYRRLAEPALQLNPALPERWKQEAKAITSALNELIAAGRQDLRL